MTGKMAGEMVAALLRKGFERMLATLQSGDKEAMDRMFAADRVAMLEDYERDSE